MQRRSLPSVPRVLLESEPENGDVLAANGVEQRLDDLGGEARLLVLVDVDDLLPVGRNLGQVEALADVHQVQDVLLETAPAKTNY